MIIGRPRKANFLHACNHTYIDASSENIIELLDDSAEWLKNEETMLALTRPEAARECSVQNPN